MPEETLQELTTRLRRSSLSDAGRNELVSTWYDMAIANTFECVVCGIRRNDNLEAFTIDAEQRFTQRDVPGESTHDEIGLPIGGRVCVACVAKCHCGRYYVRARQYNINDLSGQIHVIVRCNGCSVACAHCGNYMPIDQTTEIDGSIYCTRHLGRCQRCHQVSLLSERGSNHCQHCSARINLTVMNYSFKPTPVLKVVKPTQAYPGLFFGIEQELETKSGRTEDVTKALAMVVEHDVEDVLYAKQDGSIRCGFEMVSHPMSFEYFDERYPWSLWEPDVLPSLMTNGPEVGIHIHVSRVVFSQYHLYKFLHLHYNFPGLVEAIAGRDSRHAKLREVPLSQTREQAAVARFKPAKPRITERRSNIIMPYDRYVSVNVQNRNTIELRYFASTVEAERLRMYREWVEAAFAFTKHGKVRAPARPELVINSANFMGWLGATPETAFPRVKSLLLDEEGLPTATKRKLLEEVPVETRESFRNGATPAAQAVRRGRWG